MQSWRRPTLLLVTAMWIAVGVAVSESIPDPAPKVPMPVVCSVSEERCLTQGKLPFVLNNNCYEPLTRGPCTEKDFRLVLIIAKTPQRTIATGGCKRNICPAGKVLYKSRCYTMADASKKLCDNGEVHIDPKGDVRCGPNPGWQSLMSRYVFCLPGVRPLPPFPIS